MNEYSDFYLPKSLGAKVDIPDPLKTKIINTSDLRCTDPNSNPSDCITAKNYHVYGSAFVACEMIQRGHNPQAVVELSKLSAWFYRVTYASSLNLPNVEPGKVSEKDNTTEMLNTLKGFLRMGNDAKTCSNPLIEPNKDNLPDALALMRRWTLSGNFNQSMGEVYSNILINPVGKIDLDLNLDLDRPADWTKLRFDNAKAELKSMLTDFAWTDSQHDVGAEFAAKVCKPDPNKISKACSKN